MAKQVSGQAVKRATGKDWGEWFAILDKMGATKLSHKEIAEKLYDAFKPGLSGWWSQMVTVEYERARGMRKKGERPSGKFSVSRSATIEAPMKRIFEAWNDPGRRARFAKGIRFETRSVRPPDVVRLNLPVDGSYIEVRITAKADSKCAVVVQHEGIPDAKSATRMKATWGEALEKLRAIVER